MLYVIETPSAVIYFMKSLNLKLFEKWEIMSISVPNKDNVSLCQLTLAKLSPITVLTLAFDGALDSRS